MQIAIDRIHPASEPIRKSWDEDKLNELAQSIAEQGLIVPIKVRPENGGYEVVYGHRRLEAMRRNGASEVECFVEGLDDTNALIQALIENLQREDMPALDKGRAIRELQERTGWNVPEMTRRGIAPSEQIKRWIIYLDEYQAGSIPESIGSSDVEKIQHVQEVRNAFLVGGRSEENETKRAILEKARAEDLNWRETRRVADSVIAAPSEQARKMLLEHEFSSVIHDPEHIKARAAIHGAHDPFYQSNGPTAQKTWDSTPEVKMAIDGVVEAAKMWTALIAEIRKMVQVGKLAPEGRSFTASKLRSLANTLNRFADELDKED